MSPTSGTLISISDMELVSSAHSALRTKDARALIEIGGELERRGIFHLAWRCLGEGSRIRKPPLLPLWTGPGSSGKVLLLKRRMRHLGAELRNARFINLALQNVEKLIVATEARLVPLLARSFPDAIVVDEYDTSACAEADCEASYEQLALYFGKDRDEIYRSFVPLIPPPNSTERTPKGIGISWFSVNARKSLPPLEDWANVLRTLDCPIQSLQYDELGAGLSTLVNLAQKEIHPSLPIDQMVDIDGFAGQISNVAGVLTISNTTAHMAGALGVKCVVLLDDEQHLSWPANGNFSPFFPNLRLVRQEGRPWEHVVRQGLSLLHC